MPSIDIKTNSKDWDDLLCPRCGGNYLHHGSVIIRNRLKEDGPVEVIAITGVSEVSRAAVPLAWGRRQDLTIGFACENCDGASEENLFLHIVQHKGQTFMFWTDTRDPPKDGLYDIKPPRRLVT